MTATVLSLLAFVMAFFAIYAVLNFSKEMQKYNEKLAENSFEVERLVKKISAMRANQEKETTEHPGLKIYGDASIGNPRMYTKPV